MNPMSIYQIGKVVKVVRGRDGDHEIRSLQVQLIKGRKLKTIKRNIILMMLNYPQMTQMSYTTTPKFKQQKSVHDNIKTFHLQPVYD